MSFLNRRRFLKLSAAAPIVGLFGCQNDVWNILGYQIGNKALYDLSIDSIFVHMFYNRALQTTPYRGMEVAMTQEVVHQIGQITPYHVVSDKGRADTELIGKIVAMTKTILNVTEQNMVREGELDVSVDVVWRDLRDGRILSAQRPSRTPEHAPSSVPLPNVPAPRPPQFDEQVSQPPAVYENPEPAPMRILATGRYIPELGESNATAEQQVVQKVAAQIVSMMEKRWIKHG
jgi:hypothetical protein